MDITDLLDDSMSWDGGAGLFGLSALLKAGATKGGSSLQPAHLATLPVEQFTPGGVALTDANIQASITAARAYAVAHGGGRVVIPVGPHNDPTNYGSGKWIIPAGITIPAGSTISGTHKAGITFAGAGPEAPLFLEGAVGAGLVIPSDCDVGVYFFAPEVTPETAAPHYNGGMRQLAIRPLTDGQVTEALRINAAVNCTFENLLILGFNGASGGNYGTAVHVVDDWVDGGGNSQMCRFENLWCLTNQITYRMGEITTSYARGMNSQGSLRRAWLIEAGAEMHVHNSGIQENLPDVFVEITGTGGIMRFEGCYHEGATGTQTFFKVNTPSSYTTLVVERLRLGNPVAVFADVTDYTRLVVGECYTLGNAIKYLKALPSGGGGGANAPIYFINNSIDVADATNSAKFETNAYSLPMLTVIEGGGVYHGGKSTHGSSIKLGSFAEGSEPASPVESDLMWNTSTHRPRARTNTAHRDLAYADDPVTLVDLMRAKASDVWDLNVAAKRSVTSGGLNSVGGLIHGSSLAENSGGASRPTFTASNAAFGNRGTVTFTVGSSTFLRTTLADPIVAGEYAALFIVLGLGNPAVSGANRILANLPGTGGFFLGANDGNVGTQTYYGTNFAQNTHGATDSFAHAIYLDPWLDNGAHARVLVDGLTGTAGSGTAPAASGSLSSFDVGGQATGLVASDATVAFVALLHSPLSVAELSRAFALSAQLYAIG